MSMREWMNNNSTVVTLLAVVLLVLALGVIIARMQSRSGVTTVGMYFYNVKTNKVFVDQSDNITPFDTDSGPETGVQAFIYSCGECGSYNGATVEDLAEDGAFVAYLQKYAPEAKALKLRIREGKVENLNYMQLQQAEQNQLVRSADASEDWVVGYMGPGNKLKQSYLQRCDPDRPSPCLP